MELFNEFIAFIGTEEGERATNVILAILAAVAAAALWALGILGKLWKLLFGKQEEKKETKPTYVIRDQAQGGFAEAATGGTATGVVMGDQHVYQNAPAFPSGDMLSMDQHLTILEKREAKLTEKLASVHAEDRDVLARQIAALQAQIQNPEKSLAEAHKRIADLEALLDREGNEIAPNRIAEARAALEAGDFSVADDIFAEIETRADLEVKRAARAAYGRGEVAEEEVRWADAAAHYARAAQLNPDFASLQKASEFAVRAGDYKAATRQSDALVGFAQQHGTQEDLSSALNEHALNNRALGRYDEAEELYRQALEIDKTTIGERHPDYAIRLNNLALVLQDQGKFSEAEGLFLKALETGRATIGEEHPDYATRLNNLALVLQDQGKFSEAEGLFLKALEIGRATIGEEHPDYAIRLSNLAGVLQDQGQYAEAEELYRQSLEIGRATIGEGHPNYAIGLSNLAGVLRDQGQYAEAEELYRRSLEIGRATIGEGHPNYAIRLSNLARVLWVQGQLEEAEELLAQALKIREDALPEDHPYIAEVRADLATLRAKKD